MLIDPGGIVLGAANAARLATPHCGHSAMRSVRALAHADRISSRKVMQRARVGCAFCPPPLQGAVSSPRLASCGGALRFYVRKHGSKIGARDLAATPERVSTWRVLGGRL